MGCASSKPSSSSKNKKKDSSSNTNNKAAAGKSKQPNKSTDATNGKVVKSATTGSSELDELIKIDKKLLSQIDQHRDDVVAYIVNLVRRDLNAELVSNGGSQHSKGNMAALASAALSAPDNDSLITEASAKAISLIKGGKCETYRNLADSLKSSTFLCKNQTHKPRICELTADTIRRCLNDIYSQPSRPSGDFNLLAYLQAHQNGGVGENQLTPPATPQKIDSQKVTSASGEPGSPNEFNDSILLSRAEANKVARILFLTNRARPVIHASQRKRGAYFVNIQQDDNSEVPATRAQIEEIISPSAANRHQEQPSIYEVAETFLNNSEVALKLSPLWQSSSVSTPTHRLSTSPPVSPVQGIQGHPQVASSFDTPETPVVAGRRLKVEEEVELVVEQQVQQTSSTPITLSSPSEEEATTNENDVAAAANETIETDPAAGDGDESDARIQLGAAANLIMLANSLQNAQLDEQQADQDATVPVDEIVVDAENTSNDQIIVEETTTTRQNAEDQEPSSTSESTNLDQNNNADDKEEAAIIKQQAPEAGTGGNENTNTTNQTNNKSKNKKKKKNNHH